MGRVTSVPIRARHRLLQRALAAENLSGLLYAPDGRCCRRRSPAYRTASPVFVSSLCRQLGVFNTKRARTTAPRPGHRPSIPMVPAPAGQGRRPPNSPRGPRAGRLDRGRRHTRAPAPFPPPPAGPVRCTASLLRGLAGEPPGAMIAAFERSAAAWGPGRKHIRAVCWLYCMILL